MTNTTVNTLQSQIDSIESKLSDLRLQVSDLELQQGKIELDPDNYEDQFNELLDESIPEIEIGHLTYSPSHVLKNVDPIAYRCGLNDFADSYFNKEETDEYQSLQEEIDQLESDIEALESEIEDLQSQIEEMEETSK